MEKDLASIIKAQVVEAFHTCNPLMIVSNDSKCFYGNTIQATPLIVNQHQGIISYEPTELVITARAGTPLNEIEDELALHGQQLAFEPPYFTKLCNGNNEKNIATIGGTIACGFSGPARANNGACRDFMLGCEIINGRGEQLKFGGQVMKNVAGYDVSRLMCGSIGTLGVILNVSLKVLPKPETEISLNFILSRKEAFLKLNQWNSRPYPITASCYYDGKLTVRLAGNASAVKTTQNKLGGEEHKNSQSFWGSIREQTHSFFKTERPLWRISVKPDSEFNIDNADCLTEWHGALHWVKTSMSTEILRSYAEQRGGHATLFRNTTPTNKIDIFHPLAKPLFQIHRNIKNAFDPKDILNRHKMYRFNH